MLLLLVIDDAFFLMFFSLLCTEYSYAERTILDCDSGYYCSTVRRPLCFVIRVKIVFSPEFLYVWVVVVAPRYMALSRYSQQIDRISNRCPTYTLVNEGSSSRNGPEGMPKGR